MKILTICLFCGFKQTRGNRVKIMNNSLQTGKSGGQRLSLWSSCIIQEEDENIVQL
jgi:hypothetical protein